MRGRKKEEEGGRGGKDYMLLPISLNIHDLLHRLFRWLLAVAAAALCVDDVCHDGRVYSHHQLIIINKKKSSVIIMTSVRLIDVPN